MKAAFLLHILLALAIALDTRGFEFLFLADMESGGQIWAA